MLKELTKSSRSSIKKTNDGQLNSNRSEINQDNLQNLSYSKDNSKIIQNSQSQSKIADKLTKENSSYNERTIDTTIKSNTIKQRLNNFISDVKSQSRVKSSSVNKGTKCTSPVKDISSYYELTNRQTNLTYTKNG